MKGYLISFFVGLSLGIIMEEYKQYKNNRERIIKEIISPLLDRLKEIIPWFQGTINIKGRIAFTVSVLKIWDTATVYEKERYAVSVMPKKIRQSISSFDEEYDKFFKQVYDRHEGDYLLDMTNEEDLIIAQHLLSSAKQLDEYLKKCIESLWVYYFSKNKIN